MQTYQQMTLTTDQEEPKMDLLTVRNELGRKFTADDLWLIEPFHSQAEEYARNYEGTFEYMKSMRESVETWNGLTPKQAVGVLNCIIAEMNRRPAPSRPAAVTVPTGRFTVEFGDGEYTTLQFKPGSGNFEGKTIVSFLAGPDNTNDYVGFAMVVDGQLKVWNRFNNDHNIRKVEAANIILGTSDVTEFGHAYARQSGRCARCGRELTVPASLNRGVGPECANKGFI